MWYISESIESEDVIKTSAIKGSCRIGSILMNKKMRDDLSIDTADSVYISKIPLSKELHKKCVLGYVYSVDERLHDSSIAVSEELLENIKNKRIIKNGKVNLFTRQGTNKDVNVKKSSKLMNSEILVTLSVARESDTTYGDLVLLREPVSLRKFID